MVSKGNVPSAASCPSAMFCHPLSHMGASAGLSFLLNHQGPGINHSLCPGTGGRRSSSTDGWSHLMCRAATHFLQPCHWQGCGGEKLQPEKQAATAFLLLEKACLMVAPIAHPWFMGSVWSRNRIALMAVRHACHWCVRRGLVHPCTSLLWLWFWLELALLVAF